MENRLGGLAACTGAWAMPSAQIYLLESIAYSLALPLTLRHISPRLWQVRSAGEHVRQRAGMPVRSSDASGRASLDLPPQPLRIPRRRTLIYSRVPCLPNLSFTPYSLLRTRFNS